MTTFAVSGGPCYSYDPSNERWQRFDGILVDGGRIVSRRAEDAGAGVPRIDLGGRALYPAFADCHVHLTDTGLFLGERDFAGVRGDALKKLPLPEQPAWAQLWANVADTLRQTSDKTAPEKNGPKNLPPPPR